MDTRDIPRLKVIITTRERDDLFIQGVLELICRPSRFKCAMEYKTYGTSTAEQFFDKVFNDSADIGVLTSGIKSNRLPLAHMVNSFFDRNFVVVVHNEVVREKSAALGSAAAFSKVTSPYTWTLILSVFVVCTIFAVVSRCMTGTHRSTARDVLQVGFSFLATFFSQDDLRTRNHRRASLVVIYSVWLLFITILLGLLNSSLPPLLTVQSRKFLPFNNLESLVASNYTVFGSPLSKSLIQESSDPFARTIAANMRFNVEEFHEKENNLSALFVEISVEGHTDLEMTVCHPTILAIPDIVNIQVANFFGRVGSRKANLFEIEYLVMFERGLPQHLHRKQSWKQYSIINHTICSPKEINRPSLSTTNRLTLSFVAFPLWIMLSGFLTACVALGAEYFSVFLNRVTSVTVSVPEAMVE